MLADVGRFAEAYGLRLDPGPIADTGAACRGFLFAQERGAGAAFHDATYSARFLEGRDIGSEETLAEIAEHAGLKRIDFLSALGDGRYEEALERSNRDARADDVFGFPFFLYQRKAFWGNDRIEWLVREIRSHGRQVS
jgi:2-hydroxychromene-2-carboxylate isomerase